MAAVAGGLILAPALAKSPAPRKITIIILLDNRSTAADLAADWGFAAAILTPGGAVLFDTGPKGDELLTNMAGLGLSPGDFSAVVISHDHDDHYGGLAAFLAVNPEARVYVAGTPANAARIAEAAGAPLSVLQQPAELMPGIWSTGPIDGNSEAVEQTLVIDTAQGLVVLTGCAHPGIVEILQKAQALLPGKPTRTVIAGFHLLDATSGQFDRIVDQFRQLGVGSVAALHCSGAPAQERFAKVYGQSSVAGGSGLTLTFDPLR